MQHILLISFKHIVLAPFFRFIPIYVTCGNADIEQ